MTIYDIAKKAKVSIGTVDRVIHNRPGVSPKTAAKVKKLMAKYSYQPSIHASGLAQSGRKYRFGILMPQKRQDGNFWTQPAKGINRAAAELEKSGVSVHFHYYDKYSHDSLNKACQKILAEKYDGLAIAPVIAADTKTLINAFPKQLPYVFFDSHLPDTRPLSTIIQDAEQSGAAAGRLMDISVQGKGNIAVFDVKPLDCHVDDRIRGFSSYFQKNKQIKLVRLEVMPWSSANAFYNTAKHYLQKHKNTKGLYIPHACVFQVAKCLQELNLSNRIALIGYDLIKENREALKKGNIDFIINQNAPEQGYLAVQTLYKSIVLKEKPAKITTIPIQIVIKENI